MYQNSIDAIRQLLNLGDRKCYHHIHHPCYITKRPQRFSYTKNGEEYCFVEVTCEDDVQYGIQAFGSEALELWIEANRCIMCGVRSPPEELTNKSQPIEEIIDGRHYSFDSDGCALIFKKLRSVYGRDFCFSN
jgi:hypothetical protein